MNVNILKTRKSKICAAAPAPAQPERKIQGTLFSERVILKNKNKDLLVTGLAE